MYCMYYRGMKKGIKKAMETAVSNTPKTVVVEVMGNKASSGDITISPHVHIHGMSEAASDDEKEIVTLNDGGNRDTERCR